MQIFSIFIMRGNAEENLWVQRKLNAFYITEQNNYLSNTGSLANNIYIIVTNIDI
jgi:hypothetical protein